MLFTVRPPQTELNPKETKLIVAPDIDSVKTKYPDCEVSHCDDWERDELRKAGVRIELL